MRAEDEAFAAFRERPCDETQDALYRAVFLQARTVTYLMLRRECLDLAATSATRIVLNLEDFKGDSAFSTWSHRIIRNMVYDELRRLNQRKETSFEDANPEHIPLDVGLDGYAAILLEDVMKSCGAVDKTILEGKLFGLSEEELAEATDLTEAGVRNRWFRLKDKIVMLLKRS